MNARNDFTLDPEDIRELVAKRREQLRRGIMMYKIRCNESEQYSNTYRNSLSTRVDSPRSSLYSMERDNRSNDPLVGDYDSERSSYARRKLLRNIERNTATNDVQVDRQAVNYFYDDAVLRFDDEYEFDGSILFAKRRKFVDPNWGVTCQLPHYTVNPDQLSNDSYGYYIPDDQDSYFVNDTLTFNLPSHRASI